MFNNRFLTDAKLPNISHLCKHFKDFVFENNGVYTEDGFTGKTIDLGTGISAISPDNKIKIYSNNGVYIINGRKIRILGL